MSGTIRLGTVADMTFEIHLSVLLLIALLISTLSLGWLPQLAPAAPPAADWLAAACATVVLLASVIAHEGGHALTARISGVSVRGIALFFFGGVTVLEREPERAGTELRIAGAGPLVSLLLAAAFLAVSVWLTRGGSLPHAIAVYLSLSNLLLAVFNLLPGYPLDGGRILHAILWHATGNPQRATRWAGRAGQVVAALFMLWAVVLFFVGAPFAGLWVGFIGWFLFGATRAASGLSMSGLLIGHLSVAEVMNREPVAVPVTLTLQQLHDDYLLPRSLRAAAVVQHEHLLGLVTLGTIERFPADQWETTTVGHAMLPLERLLTVEPDQRVREALALISAYDLHHVPVVRDGRLEGMIGRDVLARYLRARRGPARIEAEQHADQRLPVVR